VKFSVVMPLFNKERFIREAVASVLGQRFTSFELIIVDDGSTDGSVRSIRDMIGGNCICLSQENRGVAAARNSGIRAANGEWIAFLDADDLWSERHLEVLDRLTRGGPTPGMVSTCYRQVPDDREPRFPERTGEMTTELRRVDFFDWAVAHRSCFQTSCIAIRREVFEEVGLFGSFDLGEDVEMWARVALKHPVIVTNDVTVARRYDPQGLMSRAQYHVPTSALGPDRLPTPVLQLLDGHMKRASGHPPSVTRYFDDRLRLGMKAALRAGDNLRAFRLWRLHRNPFDRETLAIVPLIFVPAMLLRFASRRVRAR
jgi:glycosyltransferase involved in cell wall biosynthesis